MHHAPPTRCVLENHANKKVRYESVNVFCMCIWCQKGQNGIINKFVYLVCFYVCRYCSVILCQSSMRNTIMIHTVKHSEASRSSRQKVTLTLHCYCCPQAEFQKWEELCRDQNLLKGKTLTTWHKSVLLSGYLIDSHQ